LSRSKGIDCPPQQLRRRNELVDRFAIEAPEVLCAWQRIRIDLRIKPRDVREIPGPGP
jgi:hypothetical protein